MLAVRGWERTRRRLGLGLGPGAVLAALAVLIFTAPALVRRFQGVASSVSQSVSGGLAQAQFRLTADEHAALESLAANHRAGGVLAPWLLSLSVPAFTDRQVYAGHTQWEPAGHLALDAAFYGSALRDPSGAVRRSMLARTGARFVLVDCGDPSTIGRALAPVTVSVTRFGCVSVYETR